MSTYRDGGHGRRSSPFPPRAHPPAPGPPPAGDGGWLEAIPSGLTAEQEIRARALHAAAVALGPAIGVLAAPARDPLSLDIVDHTDVLTELIGVWLAAADAAALQITDGGTTWADEDGEGGP